MKEENSIRLDEIDFVGVAKDLLRNLWLIVLSAVTFALVATTVIKFTHVDKYSSSVTFAVMAKGTNGNVYASLNTASAMTDVFAEVFQSDVMRNKVAEDMGLEAFGGEISTNIISSTNLLQLTVTTTDPKEAYFGVRSIMENYPDVADYLFGNAVLEMLKAPQISIMPSNPLDLSGVRNKAFLLGAAFMAAVIVIFSILRNTVKNKKNAMRLLDGKYLGTAPHEVKNRTLKAKIHKYNKAVLVTNPVCGFRFVQALQKLSIRIEYHMKKHQQKILMVTSYAENEGKSTIAANIAINLASKGYRVLILDLDLKRPAIYKLFQQEIEKDSGVLKAIEDIEHLEDYIVYDEKTKLYLLMNRQYVRESQDVLTSDKMLNLLKKLANVADYVIVDTPPMQVAADAEVISSLADNSILVVRQDWVDVRDINDGIDILRQGKGEFTGYILNNVYERRGTEQDFGYRHETSH